MYYTAMKFIKKYVIVDINVARLAEVGFCNLYKYKKCVFLMIHVHT